MRIALGLRAHSGWAALVALCAPNGTPELVDRRRIELVDEADTDWAKAPYHAADGLAPDEARELVKGAIASARKLAVRELREAVKRAKRDGHELAACAVLVNEPMPDWSVAEILAVHFRMHKAEGVLFRDALARAAEACGVPLLAIREKELAEVAEIALEAPSAQAREGDRGARQVGRRAVGRRPEAGRAGRVGRTEGALLASRACRTSSRSTRGAIARSPRATGIASGLRRTRRRSSRTWISGCSSACQSVNWAGVERAADLGCGTGRTAEWLKHRGVRSIDGVDLTEEMLARARERGVFDRLELADVSASGLARRPMTS